MTGWITVVVAVVAFLAVGMMRERWRMTRLERWAEPKIFAVHSPFVPDAKSPAAALASLFNVRSARRWGAAVEGASGGVRVMIAEHEASQPGAGKTGIWYTLVFWPAGGGNGTVVAWPGQPASVLRTDARVGDRLGLPDSDPSAFRMRTDGGLLVEGEPGARDAWLNPGRKQALENWPHDGAFARIPSHCAWRFRGLLTPARVEDVLAKLPEVRRLLE